MKTINIGKDYSKYPAGRYYDDGDFNGQKFREQVLVPSLVENDSITIQLDDTRGYDSSFLEEAFGGLVREMKIDLDSILRKLTLVSDDEFLKAEILSYMKDEWEKKKK